VAYRHVAGLSGDQGPEGTCVLELVDLETAERTPLRMPDGNCAVFAGVTHEGGTVVCCGARC
jgi:hypothetical protein